MHRLITIVYGEMGAGKTYTGKRLAEEFNAIFVEGDDLLTPEMVWRVSNFRPLTPEMIEEFVHCHLLREILRQAIRGDVVVAQALYRREHRDFLERTLHDLGHEVHFVHVKVPFFQNLRQLLSRSMGVRWVFYWLINKPFFQP